MNRADDPELERWRTAYAAAPGDGPHPGADRWRAFFEGTLTADEAAATRDHVAACPQCAAIFKAARSAALAAATPESGRELPQPRRQWITVAATLSIATLAIVVLWPLQDRDVTLAPNAPVATAPPAATPAAPVVRFEKPPVVVSAEQLLVSRGNTAHTAYLEALAAALKPYQADDFAAAIELLAPLAGAHPDRFEPAYYLGVSLLLNERARDAVPHLERAVTLASAARRDEAERALAAARSMGGR